MKLELMNEEEQAKALDSVIGDDIKLKAALYRLLRVVADRADEPCVSYLFQK